MNRKLALRLKMTPKTSNPKQDRSWCGQRKRIKQADQRE